MTDGQSDDNTEC